MNYHWKKWAVIVGSSIIATTAFTLTPLIPVIAPIIMIGSVLGGAITATIIELKEEYHKSIEKEKVEEKAEEQKVEYKTIEEAFRNLMAYAEIFQINEINEEVRKIYEIAKKMSESTEYLDEEELFFVYNVLFKDLYQLFHSFNLFTPQEKTEKKDEIIEVIIQVEEKMEEIYAKIKSRKERNFEKTKVFIQEKLKRY